MPQVPPPRPAGRPRAATAAAATVRDARLGSRGRKSSAVRFRSRPLRGNLRTLPWPGATGQRYRHYILLELPAGSQSIDIHGSAAMNDTALQQQMAELARGTQDLLLPADLERKLARGQPLKVKAGFDPTAPDLHLGHTVLINKMRAFQQFGHEVIFLIGDFTGLIGDPAGRNATRPRLTAAEVQANARTYEQQIFRILDRERTRVDFNSRWFGSMGASGLIEIAARHTVARMLEREDFSKRYRAGEPIAMHEFLY